MQVDSAAASAAFVVTVFALAAYAAFAGGDGLTAGDGVDVDDVEALVVDVANEERVERGLEPLEHDPALSDAAARHAGYMAANDHVGHEGSDGSRPLDRYGDVCSGSVGENVANTWHSRNILYGDDEMMHLASERDVAEHLVRKWMDSERHRETLTAEHWRSVGVAVAEAEGNEVYAAQAFCSG